MLCWKTNLNVFFFFRNHLQWLFDHRIEYTAALSLINYRFLLSYPSPPIAFYFVLQFINVFCLHAYAICVNWKTTHQNAKHFIKPPLPSMTIANSSSINTEWKKNRCCMQAPVAHQTRKLITIRSHFGVPNRWTKTTEKKHTQNKKGIYLTCCCIALITFMVGANQ